MKGPRSVTVTLTPVVEVTDWLRGPFVVGWLASSLSNAQVPVRS